LRNAIEKHGRDWFTFTVIEHHSSPEQAEQSEMHWISTLRSMCGTSSVYNLNDGGERVNYTDEVRQKLSEAGKRRIVKEETREKHRQRWTGANNPNFGKPMSVAAKEKMAATKRGKPSPNKGKPGMRGLANPNAKVTKEAAQDVLALRATGLGLGPIAKRVGLSKRTVHRICSGKHYSVREVA
jgi:hypothetical protein